MGDDTPSFGLTPAEIIKWQQQCAQIDSDIERLRKDKLDIEERLKAAQLLFPSLVILAQPEKTKGRGQAIIRKGLLTWPHIIEEAVRNSGTGIRQRDLLEDIRSGKHGKRLDVGELGYYNAIQKVLKRGMVIKHGEWLFTPAQFEEYTRKLEAGEIEDYAENTEHGSPTAAEMVRFVTANPGKRSPEVITHIWSVQEDQGEPMQSKTSLYNVVKRLIEQKKLTKDSRGGLHPYKENEPPAEETPPDGSDAGEAGTSLFDNVVDFGRTR